LTFHRDLNDLKQESPPICIKGLPDFLFVIPNS
jgi:hypothetical protein